MADSGVTENEKEFHTTISESLTWTVDTPATIEQLELYTPAGKGDEVPIIPDPSVFQFDHSKKPQDGSFRLPKVAECAVHLEFLATLSTLRSNVLNSQSIDRTIGFSSEKRPTQDKADSWQEGKWKKYVDFAVVRFIAWRSCMNERCKVGKMNKEIFAAEEAHQIPIDILMVWSVFMLNPGLYEVHCSKELIYELELPWESIHESIDSEEKWKWEPPRRDNGVMDALGLGYDLFGIFEHWDFPIHQVRGKEYPGLCEFDFNRQEIDDKECPDLEHIKLVNHYVKAFSKVEISLANELKEGMLRQELFWRKMTDHLWIRSPALKDTLRRAITRYDKFMEIMKRNPKTQVVPTLDIDLVWHTHQCSGGRAYAIQTENRTGRFVSHNDKLGQGSLVIGYGATSELYRSNFGSEYRICGCWECEILISEMEAVVDLEPKDVDMSAIIKEAKKRMQFYRAVETLRRSGRPLPAVQK